MAKSLFPDLCTRPRGPTKYNGDLFSSYLHLRREAPSSLPAQWNLWALRDEVPGDHSSGFTTRKRQANDYKYNQARLYWQAYIRLDPILAAWLKSEDAFRAPDDWPTKLALPQHVTPRIFADNIMPSGTEQAIIRADLHKMPYLEHLAAWAHGWPVPRVEWPKMERCATLLTQHPLFLIWAYHLDLSGLPVPFSVTIDYFKRLHARSVLVKAPLEAGENMMRWALPEMVLEDPSLLLLHCSRKSLGVGPSGKISRLLG